MNGKIQQFFHVPHLSTHIPVWEPLQYGEELSEDLWVNLWIWWVFDKLTHSELNIKMLVSWAFTVALELAFMSVYIWQAEQLKRWSLRREGANS